MTCVPIEGGSICGNYARSTKRRPKNWIECGYKIVVPYRFKWRAKLGKATCTCTTVREHYQPYYGTTWYHADDCAIIRHLKRYPGIENFMWDRDPRVIAGTD